MKKIFTIFFVTLGVIFAILILAGVYMFVFDPLNIKPLFQKKSVPSETSPQTTQKEQNQNISPSQKKALETFGIDPKTLPTSLTPIQEACFIKILGEARVSQIKAGDVPTPSEFLSAKSCL